MDGRPLVVRDGKARAGLDVVDVGRHHSSRCWRLIFAVNLSHRSAGLAVAGHIHTSSLTLAPATLLPSPLIARSAIQSPGPVSLPMVLGVDVPQLGALQ